MIKTIYICDKCGKQKTEKGLSSCRYLPENWVKDYYYGEKYHFCSKKCKPRRAKTKGVNPNEDSDPGVGSLYGRT